MNSGAIFAGRRVLVAGCAGFLGSHLVDRLLGGGAHVIGVDNLKTGTRENLAHLADDGRFSLLEADIITPLDIKTDFIFNLACPASPPHYQADPVNTLKTSVIGTLNLLELATANSAGLLHASTSEVYGDPKEHPQREAYWGNVNPIGIRACYDEGKRAAETLCFDYRRTRGTDVKVVRIFNTYGPRMHPEDGRVVSNFIVQSLRGEALTVYGNGQQTRSFCYVDDLIEGFVRMAATRPDVSGPVNLGNPREFTMLQLAELVNGITGSPASLKYMPLPSDDPKQRCPDVSFAKELIGWTPQTPLEDGLRKTVDYFSARLALRRI
jgi:UDP-glucuronate decarboxylase